MADSKYVTGGNVSPALTRQRVNAMFIGQLIGTLAMTIPIGVYLLLTQ